MKPALIKATSNVPQLMDGIYQRKMIGLILQKYMKNVKVIRRLLHLMNQLIPILVLLLNHLHHTLLMIHHTRPIIHHFIQG